MKERLASETALMRQKIRGRLMERSGLTIEGWMRIRFGKKREYIKKLLARYLEAEKYPREISQAYRIIKALEKETGLKLCG